MWYLRMTFKYWEWAPWKRAIPHLIKINQIKTVCLIRTLARIPRRSRMCVEVLNFRIREVIGIVKAGETQVCFIQLLTCMMEFTPARTSEASITKATKVRPIRSKEQDSRQRRREHKIRSPGGTARRTHRAKETSRFSCITLRMSPANMDVRTQLGQLTIHNWSVRWTRLQKQTRVSTRCQIHLQRIHFIQTSIMQSRLTLTFLARGMRMLHLITNSNWWKTTWQINWERREIIGINWIYSRIRIWRRSAISLEWIRLGQRVR